MIRLATALDATLMARLLQEFADSIGSGTVIDPVRLANRIQRWPQIQAVDDVAGVYCELKVKERDHMAEFSAAFPRGASRGLIGPVFAFCAREAIRRLRAGPNGNGGPVRRYTVAELATWRVWGEFLHGQTAARVPDGGREIAQAWVDYFALDSKTVTIETRGELAIPSMLLADLAAHAL